MKRNIPSLSKMLAFLLAAAACHAQPPGGDAVEVMRVQGTIYLIAHAGANITVQVGNDGLLLVDAGIARMSGQILAALQKIAPPNAIRYQGRIRYIVDTSADADHTGGNESLSKTGVGTGTNDVGTADHTSPADIIAHERVARRMASPGGKETPAPTSALPFDTYVGGGVKDLFFDDDGVQVIHVAAAHTDGDSMVYFRKNDVVSAGDIFVTTGYPVIDVERGGGIEGEIEGLNKLLDIMIPGRAEEGGTIVVPGHGRLCDEADVVEYRDMVTILRDRIKAMADKGATLAQVKAANLTRDYDPQYGRGGPGAWPTDKFVEAVYQSLAQKK
jgi:cyclase